MTPTVRQVLDKCQPSRGWGGYARSQQTCKVMTYGGCFVRAAVRLRQMGRNSVVRAGLTWLAGLNLPGRRIRKPP